MAETEVESILREIRERVVAQQRASNSLASSGNGAGANDAEALERNQTLAQNLALINSYLTTTGRAWDRLPPVVSNRSGVLARVELWLKRRLRATTRWFTWEQVNFNAAVHHALRDLLPVLSAYEDELARLRSQIAASETRRQALEESHAATTAQLNDQLTSIRSETAAQYQTARNQTDHRVAELRDRIAALQEELRVCFKQSSLETSEAAVLEDRARRKTEVLLEELQRRVDGVTK